MLLRRLTELGVVTFDGDGTAVDSETPPSVWARFDAVRYDPDNVVPLAQNLQQLLNKIPGIHLREDGRAGKRTSDAYKQVTGQYLQGDPRNG